MIVRIVLALAVILAATAAQAAKLKVVASFSIIGDMAARVGGDKVEVKTLVGPDGDAHVFQPAPADARAIAEAQLILLNGLGFEPWAQRLIEASDAKGKVVVVSRGVRARQMQEEGGQQIPDPHAWQDLANGQIYVDNIAQAYTQADARNVELYKANGAAYFQELGSLDRQVKTVFGALPKAQRRVITSHDAFGYFGAAYGVTFIAPLGTSTEDQASAKGVARLIEQIRREKISAVFVENITDPRLVQQIAQETGTRLGGELFSDALSKAGGPAPTYVDMFQHNVRALRQAMAPGQ